MINGDTPRQSRPRRQHNRPQPPARLPAFTVAPGLTTTLNFEFAGRLGDFILAQNPVDKQIAAYAHNLLNAVDGDEEEGCDDFDR